MGAGRHFRNFWPAFMPAQWPESTLFKTFRGPRWQLTRLTWQMVNNWQLFFLLFTQSSFLLGLSHFRYKQSGRWGLGRFLEASVQTKTTASRAILTVVIFVYNAIEDIFEINLYSFIKFLTDNNNGFIHLKCLSFYWYYQTDVFVEISAEFIYKISIKKLGLLKNVSSLIKATCVFLNGVMFIIWIV